MRQIIVGSLVTLLLVFGAVLSADALTITPTFNDSAGETWDTTRRGVVQQAIDDWTSNILDDQTVSINFEFTAVGTGNYLGQWSGQVSAYAGTDIYPWSPEVTHTISFRAINWMWWDPTPTTAGDQSLKVLDALSVARHELGHALGFADDFYVDDFNNPTEIDKWSSHITGSTFDPGVGGMNVSLASSSNLAHLLDSGATDDDLMVPALEYGQRRDISDTDLNMLSLAYGYQMVPEPSTLVLLVIGIVGLLAFQRRRRS